MIDIEPTVVLELLDREQTQFARQHPYSLAAHTSGQDHYLYGAPSHWMRRWPGGFPLTVKSAHGARLQCIDGLDYVDFCLGDSGAMCGHGPECVTAAVALQMSHGATSMLPSEAAQWVGQELTRRFGLPYWGFTTSASDANRAAIRIARMVTKRSKVLVFNGCYHGSVEEAHVAIADGKVGLRNGIHANAVDHERVSRVVEFNDLAALDLALADTEVACVLAEPMMTNYGMISPQFGFHASLRALTRRHGTLLILDETHTLSNGPGGYSAQHGLEPDMLVVGKAIGGGIPVGLFGVSQGVAERLWTEVPKVNPALVRQSAHLGFGGTLAGSALQVAAVRAVLEHVLTPVAHAHMNALAESLALRARAVLRRYGCDSHVEQSGARVEVMFGQARPDNARDVAAGRNPALEALLHVYFMNRGVLITPFHCMLLLCPATTALEVDRFIDVLQQFCDLVVRSSTHERASA